MFGDFSPGTISLRDLRMPGETIFYVPLLFTEFLASFYRDLLIIFFGVALGERNTLDDLLVEGVFLRFLLFSLFYPF